MKKTSLLALALAPMILGTPMALQAQDESVTTDPVGFVKLTLEQGLQTVGAAMVRPAVAAGTVASSDATSITLEAEIAGLNADTAYYVEVSAPKGAAAGDDAWLGDRFDVDVAASSGSTLVIDVANDRNTIDLSSVTGLAGYSVVVRPHVTLDYLLPPSELQAGDGNTGDQVLFWNRADNAFEIHTLEEGVEFLEIPDRWASGGQATGDRVIPPGEGFFIRRRGSATTLLTNIGEVRTNDFRQPLGLGLNLISEGHPIDNSPATRLFTADNGMQPGDGNTGDQILVFSEGSFDIYTFEEGVEFLEIPDAWRSGGEVYDTAELLAADGAVFYRKRGEAVSDYTAPQTF